MTKRTPKAAAKRVYLLRTCRAGMTSYDGFKWPVKGKVVCPDWDPKPECGGGLHGLLWGEGNGNLLDWSPEAKWLVFSALASEVVVIDSAKAKAKRGVVEYVGDQHGATQFIREKGARGPVVGITLTAGNDATLTAGDGATLTGGYRATLTGGYRAKLSGGDGATLTGGDYAKLTAGDGAKLTGGHGSTLTGGDGATLTGGYGSTLTGGNGSKLTAGNGATLSIRWWDGTRYRLAVGYVGEDGIELGVAYVVVDGKFTKESK